VAQPSGCALPSRDRKRAVLAILIPFLLSTPAPAANYDLLIRNARVVDGTGAPWFRADLAIANGKIAAIGRLNSATAAKVIDAKGRILAPGFIDSHTHIEGEIERLPRADNFLRDGVTTVVTGNCGGSARDVAAWLARLETLPLGINIATLYGHNTARREVMGADNRAPSPEELARMRDLVEQAMSAGAYGLSTGLEYVPGVYAQPEEIIDLAKVAARHGGVYASHMRNEGDAILDSLRETARVGREAGLPVQVSHIKIDTPRVWGLSKQAVALLDDLRREGIDIVADFYPYECSATTLGLTVPAWALAGGAQAFRERLAVQDTKAKIVAGMKQLLERRGHADYTYATVASYPADRAFEGLTIREITKRGGHDPTLDNQIETIIAMLQAGGASMTYHSMSEADMEVFLRWPHTAIASDGGVRIPGEGVPHPRSYGTNARVIARNLLPLEEAVRRMTSLPARTFGLSGRGLIRPGQAADLVLFDPAKVRDKATYEAPHQFSEGFDTVIVNGQLMIDEGALTTAKAGRPLRNRRPSASLRGQSDRPANARQPTGTPPTPLKDSQLIRAFRNPCPSVPVGGQSDRPANARQPTGTPRAPLKESQLIRAFRNPCPSVPVGGQSDRPANARQPTGTPPPLKGPRAVPAFRNLCPSASLGGPIIRASTNPATRQGGRT
jgi:N-acyl-D-amino-acid deacylase